MKITTNYNYLNNFKSNKSNAVKVIKGNFFDGSNAVIQIVKNNENAICNINAYKLKNNKIVGGMGIGKGDGLSTDAIMTFFEKWQDAAGLGINYFKELAKFLLK